MKIWDDLDLGRDESERASAVARSFRALLLEAAKIRPVLLAVQLIVGVAVPIGVSYAANLATSGDDKKESIGRLAIGFIAVVQAVLLVALVFGPQTPARVIVEHERLIQERDKFREHGRSLALVGKAFLGSTVCSGQASRRAVELLQRQNHPVDDLEGDLTYILEPYMDAQHRALGFSQRSGQFRITVFRLSDDLEELVPVCSLREKNVVPRRRTFSREGSHAGQAIRALETKVTPDARNATEFLDAFDEEDRRNCVSMASFPLFEGPNVFGAATVCCNLLGQFDEDGVEQVFDTLGGILSLYLSSRYSDAQENPDSQGLPSEKPGVLEH